MLIGLASVVMVGIAYAVFGVAGAVVLPVLLVAGSGAALIDNRRTYGAWTARGYAGRVATAAPDQRDRGDAAARVEGAGGDREGR